MTFHKINFLIIIFIFSATFAAASTLEVSNPADINKSAAIKKDYKKDFGIGYS